MNATRTPTRTPGILCYDGTYRCAEHVDTSTYAREAHAGDAGEQCLYCGASVTPDLDAALAEQAALRAAGEGIAREVSDLEARAETLDATLEASDAEHAKYTRRAYNCVVGFHVRKNFMLAEQVAERAAPVRAERERVQARLEALHRARAANGAAQDRAGAAVRALRDAERDAERGAQRPTRRAVVSLAVTEQAAVTGVGAGALGVPAPQPSGPRDVPYTTDDLVQALLRDLGGDADDPDDVDAAYALACDVVTAHGGVPAYLPGDVVSHRSGLTTGRVTGYGAPGEVQVMFHGAERATVHAGRYLSTLPVPAPVPVSVAVLRAAEARL